MATRRQRQQAWRRGAVAAAVLGLPLAAAEGVLRYGVATWPTAGLGNHRVVVRVPAAAEAVRVHIPWRRRDREPERKAVLVVDATTGKQVANRMAVAVTREAGDLVFEPVTAPGDYYVYYLPYTTSGLAYSPTVTYAPPTATAAPAWLETHGLTPEALPSGRWRSLPEVQPAEAQAVSGFHRFDPMEVIATADEVQGLLARHPQRACLLFPEDRAHPIRMPDDLPWCWIERGPGDAFRGAAQPGEYYAFQVGLLAARQALAGVTVTFSDLRAADGRTIPAAALTCFNLEGSDWLGRRLQRPLEVARGRVAALWCGAHVPRDAPAGDYTGTVTVGAQGVAATPVTLVLHVAGQVLDDAGDSDLRRLARLRWLNSTIGLDDEVVAPYTPLSVQGRTVGCLGRQVRFGDRALPESIRCGEREVLAGPIVFRVRPHGDAPVEPGSPPTTPAACTASTPGRAVYTATDTVAGLARTCAAAMEADGYINVVIGLRAERAVETEDMALEIPVRREVATYLMGLGRKGGTRPPTWQWTWDPGRATNLVWVGDIDAGLQCKLKGPLDLWSLGAPEPGAVQTWGNGGKGGCTVTEDGDTVLVRAYTGPRRLAAGQTLEFRCGLLITPVKPLDPAHWRQRYLHTYTTVPPLAEAAKAGANILNLHQGNDHNPYINYPFLTVDKLAAYATAAHAQGAKVKIYYTVRELSNFTAELFALRSLGHEVFTGGGGGGDSWLQEHLVSDYGAAWHQPYANGEVDAALGQQGLSRWHNYYLEGLAWLVRTVGIDGLYLDGIGYDRQIMKRVRKVMDRQRPGCLIDFHSGNSFAYADMRASPASIYMEHFPYIDSLWFGEMYDYNETPDYWLVEVSGIPFGLYGEMLEGGGNPWRGMLYGMTNRLGWGGDPRPVWAIWDEFGIDQATMLGYWNTACPVRTSRPDVLATVYRRPGRSLVALASWAPEPVTCELRIDWAALGFDPARANLFAPAVKGYQPTALFRPADAIPVAPARGWLFYVDEQPHPVPPQVDAYSRRTVLLEDAFGRPQLGDPWTVALSAAAKATLVLRDGAVVIEAADNGFAFARRPLPAGVTLVECTVDTGTDVGATWGPGLILEWPGGKAVRINVRSMGTFGVDNGADFVFGGFTQPRSRYHLRVRVQPEEVVAEASADGQFWEAIHALPRRDYPGDPVAVSLGKTGPGGRAEDHSTMARPGTCSLRRLRVFGAKP